MDANDLAVLAAGFGQTSVAVDMDNDLDVDGAELHLMAADYGRSDCFD